MSSGDPPPDADEDAPFGDEPVELPIEEWIDLHTFSPRELPELLEAYLEAAAEKGFREVRIVHGRGTGVLRKRVRSLLSRHPLVERFDDAPPERGGWGATLAWIRSRES